MDRRLLLHWTFCYRTFGLRLYDLQFYHQSRRALPYPGLHDYRLPSGERFFAYTTHGQIQDGDALYFRDLLVEANARVRDEISPRSVLKLCAFLEIYSFNDCAAELILAFRDKLSSFVDHSHLVDLLASGTAGSALRYEDYLRDYFDPTDDFPCGRHFNIFGWFCSESAAAVDRSSNALDWAKDY